MYRRFNEELGEDTDRKLGSATEAALVAGLRRNDPRAYDQLVKRYQQTLYNAALRILKDEDEAWDCVQEGFLTALRKIDAFQGRSQVGSWLYRIVVNLALMKRRAHKRKAEVPLEDAGLEVDYNQDPGPSAEGLLLASELSLRVRRAIAQLPEAQRAILQLRDIEDCDTAETAARLGISPGAVKTRLHRARAALKRLLDDVDDGDFDLAA
ncbi:MAG: RNA polymerase sigma factor [Candidatus Competibacterales bacterium]